MSTYQRCFRNIVVVLCVAAVIALGVSDRGIAGETAIVISHQSLGLGGCGAGVASYIDYLGSFRQISATCYSIGDGVSADSVKNIIRNHYYSAPTLPSYVIIIGSAKQGGADSIANAASANFVPSFYSTDAFGHRSMYDGEYGQMDTVGLSHYRPAGYPNITVARIPALSAFDVNYYANNVFYRWMSNLTSQYWQNDALFVIGDKTAEAGQPPAEHIRSAMKGLMTDNLPTGMEADSLAYSYFANDQAREDSLSAEFNQGKLIVVGMSTGANANDFCGFWRRTANPPQFSTQGSLSPGTRAPILLGFSCSLGQIDGVGCQGSCNTLIENVLGFGNPNHEYGAIACVGPSGSSGQHANEYFAQEMLSNLVRRPFGNLGEAFTAAKVQAFRNVRDANLYDTHQMYTLIGDPATMIFTYDLVLEDVSFSTGFEVSDLPRAREYAKYQVSDQISDDSTRVVFATSASKLRDNRYYKVYGQDNPGASSPKSHWTLFSNLAIPIDITNRFLTYNAKFLSHPDQFGKIAIGGILSSGARLTDSATGTVVKDQYGTPLAAIDRVDEIYQDQSKFLAFDLLPHLGDTITSLLIEYDATDPGNSGAFEAHFDDVAVCSTWGSAPVVGEINMSDTISTATSGTASVSAEDVGDIFYLGDSLSFEWTASQGTFTGDGAQVTYTAPHYGYFNVSVTCVVSDRGGNQIERNKTVYISEDSAACPTFYVRTEKGYEEDNVILTGSEDLRNVGSDIVDYCPLSIEPSVVNGNIRLMIAEEEKETTYLDYLELLQVETDLAPNERLAITTDGRLVAVSDPVYPIRAQSSLGYELSKSATHPDRWLFEYFGPGELILVYPRLDTLFELGDSKGSGSGGGGIGDLPPPKTGYKAMTGNLGQAFVRGNNVTYEYLGSSSSGVELSRVYPRIRSTIPILSDLTTLVQGDPQPVVKITWTERYSTDCVPFYTYRELNQRTVIPTQSLADSRNRYDIDVLREADGDYAVIEPRDSLEVVFAVGDRPVGTYKYILKVVGHYSTEARANLTDENMAQLSVSDPYPNPFNSSVSLKLHIPATTNLEVEVFNVLGQHVTSLHSGRASPGALTLRWEGRNSQGSTVASGMYFYRIVTDQQTLTKKMLFLK